MPGIQKSFRLPPDTLEEVEQIATETGKDFSTITKDLLKVNSGFFFKPEALEKLFDFFPLRFGNVVDIHSPLANLPIIASFDMDHIFFQGSNPCGIEVLEIISDLNDRVGLAGKQKITGEQGLSLENARQRGGCLVVKMQKAF
jgi:hypothetical protein